MVTPRQLDQKAQFYRQLGQMTEVGITIPKALETVARHAYAKPMREALNEVLLSLQQGSSFGSALITRQPWIPPFDIALLGAGEESGRLSACLNKLAVYYEERARALRRVLKSLAYPVFLIHMAVLVFPVSSLQSLVTQGSIVTFIVAKVLTLLPLYLAVFLISYLTQGTRGSTLRYVVETFVTFVPVLGAARKSMAMSRFCMALEALVSSGTGLIHCFELAAAASGSLRLQRVVEGFIPQMEAGETPAELIAQSNFFPDEFVQQFHSAELSGKIDETLVRLYRFYEDQASRQSHAATVLGGGIVFGIVMIAIAWQVIQFWLGYFNQINQVIP